MSHRAESLETSREWGERALAAREYRDWAAARERRDWAAARAAPRGMLERQARECRALAAEAWQGAPAAALQARPAPAERALSLLVRRRARAGSSHSAIQSRTASPSPAATASSSSAWRARQTRTLPTSAARKTVPRWSRRRHVSSRARGSQRLDHRADRRHRSDAGARRQSAHRSPPHRDERYELSDVPARPNASALSSIRSSRRYRTRSSSSRTSFPSRPGQARS